jgi:hypothetical protein
MGFNDSEKPLSDVERRLAERRASLTGRIELLEDQIEDRVMTAVDRVASDVEATVAKVACAVQATVDRVQGNLHGTVDRVHSTVDRSLGRIDDSVQGLIDGASNAIDMKAHFEEKPLIALGVSVFAGAVLAKLLGSGVLRLDRSRFH